MDRVGLVDFVNRLHRMRVHMELAQEEVPAERQVDAVVYDLEKYRDRGREVGELQLVAGSEKESTDMGCGGSGRVTQVDTTDPDTAPWIKRVDCPGCSDCNPDPNGQQSN